MHDESQGDGNLAQDLLRRDVFSDLRLGPVARNIIKLWYVGIWYELPPEWIDAFGAREKNYTFMVSASAYTEGLLWPADRRQPPGRQGPGLRLVDRAAANRPRCPDRRLSHGGEQNDERPNAEA